MQPLASNLGPHFLSGAPPCVFSSPHALFLSFYLLTLLPFSNLPFLFTAVRPGESPEDPRWEQIGRGGQEAGGHWAGSQGEEVTKCLARAVLAHKSVLLWCKKKQRQRNDEASYYQFGKAFASMSSRNLHSQAFSHFWPYYSASYHCWKMFPLLLVRNKWNAQHHVVSSTIFWQRRGNSKKIPLRHWSFQQGNIHSLRVKLTLSSWFLFWWLSSTLGW